MIGKRSVARRLFGMTMLMFGIAGSAQAEPLPCIGNGAASHADYDYGYLYYSKPCLSASGEQKAIYYRKKIIAGIASDQEEVQLPDRFSHGFILDVIGPDNAYMVQPDGTLGFASLDGATIGEVRLIDNGREQDYLYPEDLGRGDNGFYYKIRLAGGERVMHVDGSNHATLITVPEGSRLYIPDLYSAPALWIDFDRTQQRIRAIIRAKDQRALVDASYFQAHGWIHYRSLPEDIVPRASVDGRVVGITGDLYLGEAPGGDLYRQNKIVVLRLDGAMSEHTGDPYDYGVDDVKLSPSGNYYAYTLGAHVLVYDANNHQKIKDIAAPEYVKYLVKSNYGIYFKTDHQMVLFDGDGFAFNLDLR